MALTLLLPIAWPPHSQSNAGVETILLTWGAWWETSRVTSVWTWSLPLEGRFNKIARWRQTSICGGALANHHLMIGLGNILPSLASSQWNSTSYPLMLGNQQWPKKIGVIGDYPRSLSSKVDVLCLQEHKLTSATADRNIRVLRRRDNIWSLEASPSNDVTDG